MLRIVMSLRLPALLFSVPYTLLWVRAMPSGERAVSGALLVVAHAALLLLALLLADRREAEAGRGRHLALTRSLWRADPALLDGAIGLLALVLGFMTLLLVVMDWPMAGALAVFGLVGAWHAFRPFATQRRAIELLAPLVVLVAPMSLVALRARPVGVGIAPEVDGVAAIAPVGPVGVAAMTAPLACATLLGAAAMALLILLTLVRDGASDRAMGARTTATARSGEGARALVWLWTVGVVLLASMGAGWGWWHWGVAAAAGVGGAALSAAMASGAHDRAVTAWAWAHGVMAVALCMSAG